VDLNRRLLPAPAPTKLQKGKSTKHRSRQRSSKSQDEIDSGKSQDGKSLDTVVNYGNQPAEPMVNEFLAKEWEILQKAQLELKREKAAFEMEKNWHRSNVRWEIDGLALSRSFFENEKLQFQRAVEIFRLRTQDDTPPVTPGYGFDDMGTEEEEKYGDAERLTPDEFSFRYQRNQSEHWNSGESEHAYTASSRIGDGEEEKSRAMEALTQYKERWEKIESTDPSTPWPVPGGSAADMRKLPANVCPPASPTQEKFVEMNTKIFFLEAFGVRNPEDPVDRYLADDHWYTPPNNREALKRQLWIERTRWHPDKLSRRKVGANAEQVKDLDEMGKIVFQTISDQYDRIVQVLETERDRDNVEARSEEH